jgi:hypothetical protein
MRAVAGTCGSLVTKSVWVQAQSPGTPPLALYELCTGGKGGDVEVEVGDVLMATCCWWLLNESTLMLHQWWGMPDTRQAPRLAKGRSV